jgi:hypothetical protein
MAQVPRKRSTNHIRWRRLIFGRPGRYDRGRSELDRLLARITFYPQFFATDRTILGQPQAILQIET